MNPFGGCNFTSFDPTGFWLPDLDKINIFIGRNNSGKSNILKFIQELSRSVNSPNSAFKNLQNRHWDKTSNPVIQIGISLRDLGLTVDGLPNLSPEERAEIKPDEYFKFRLNAQNYSLLVENPFNSNPSLNKGIRNLFGRRNLSDEEFKAVFEDRHIGKIRNILSAQFSNTFFIPQFREFRYDNTERGHDGNRYIDDDNVGGYKLAERLAWMKSPGVDFNNEKKKFEQVSDWVKKLLDLPDLEIDFEDPIGEKPRAVILEVAGLRRYLESFGSGIHQLVIMCFALSLKKKTLVCIEEPETFLHPGLQRKFIDFLRETDNTYFITTHSNVLLDNSSYTDTRVFHVQHRDKSSKVIFVQTSPDAYSVLDELQCHASDLMQANGVIWVEGPTDRFFLLKWFELLGIKAEEGVHFSIMFYGGKLLSHLSLDPDNQGRDLISLLKLNRNAVLILDSDRRRKNSRLSDARKRLVQRLESEINSEYGWIWITKGREIENYLSEGTLSRFCQENWNDGYKLSREPFSKLDDMIRYGPTKRRKFGYSSNKVKYCKEILPFIKEEDLNVLDLKRNITRLQKTINSWNPQTMTSSS